MLVYSNTCRFCLILVDKETVSLFYNDSSISLPGKIMAIANVQVRWLGIRRTIVYKIGTGMLNTTRLPIRFSGILLSG